MKLLRRALLELWAILIFGGIIAFLGPFGTYLMGDFPRRFLLWWMLIMGAYVITRPMMVLFKTVARHTQLPIASMVFWGVLISSFPLALLWRLTAPDAMVNISSYSGMLPFALLCSFAVMMVAGLAHKADIALAEYFNFKAMFEQFSAQGTARALPTNGSTLLESHSQINNGDQYTKRPKIYDRLGKGFIGHIIALESEDHYVRVHGDDQSELVLMRLRDAIDEVEELRGEQTHRGWWVSKDAVVSLESTGRKHHVKLRNGMMVPVARDSLDRLMQTGFLPG